MHTRGPSKLLIGFILLIVATAFYSTYAKSASRAEFQAQTKVRVAFAGMYLTLAESKPFSEYYMLFGADSQQTAQPYSQGFIATVQLDKANRLMQQHPDLGRCGTTGAGKIQNEIKPITLVGTTQAASKEIAEVKRLHDAALAGNAQRICVRLDGVWLNTDHVTNDEGRPVVMSNIKHMAHAKHITVIPCQ